jgi:hypothetical protein
MTGADSSQDSKRKTIPDWGGTNKDPRRESQRLKTNKIESKSSKSIERNQAEAAMTAQNEVSTNTLYEQTNC